LIIILVNMTYLRRNTTINNIQFIVPIVGWNNNDFIVFFFGYRIFLPVLISFLLSLNCSLPSLGHVLYVFRHVLQLVLRRAPAFTCQDKLVKLFVSQKPKGARKKTWLCLFLVSSFFWLCFPEVLCVSRKVTKRHGEQGKLRTLMNRRGAVENPVRKNPRNNKKIF